MKNLMNRTIVWLGLLLGMCLAAVDVRAQSDEDYKYDRASLYMMMIQHPKYTLNKEIATAFEAMPTPDRFNDHALNVKSIYFATDDKDERENIENFIAQVDMGRKLVSKWFGRDKTDGSFNVDLIKERGLYNATVIDKAIASRTYRGTAVLEDAGENLIGKTYLVMNDIIYSPAAKGVAKVATFIPGVQMASGSFTSVVKGFRLRITSYLYRLKWTDEEAARFYSEFYTDKADYSKQKAEAYMATKGLFQMEYVGQVDNTSTAPSLIGIKNDEELIRKATTRALDKNLSELQHEFEGFRIKAPLVSTEPLQAYVGMKEDITEESRFEVLERSQDNDGRTHYKRIGIIKPVKDQIWDNRYMAEEEEAPFAKLGRTTFERVSGGDFYPGLLIREIDR